MENTSLKDIFESLNTELTGKVYALGFDFLESDYQYEF